MRNPRALFVALAAAAFAVPAFAGAWVYRDALTNYSGIVGYCPSCCEQQPGQTGHIDDGHGTFSGNQFPGDYGSCGDKTWRWHSQYAWQSPPHLLAPGKPLAMDASIRFDDVEGLYPGNPVLGQIQLWVNHRGRATPKDRATLSTLTFSPQRTFRKDAAGTLTVAIPDGAADQHLYIQVNTTASGGGVGGSYRYHYAFDPNAQAPDGNVATGAVANTPDGSAPGPDTASGSDAAGAGASSAGPSDTTAVLAGTAAATVLGGLLVSLGTLFAGGLNGSGPGAIGATLTGILKGKLPADGFEEWQDKASKIYGTGAPDDPFRDYPDAKNPPWKAAYGDGSAASPFSDTAPPVIDHTPTPADSPPPVTTTVSVTPVLASGGMSLASEIHTEPFKFQDQPLQKIEPVPDKPQPPAPPTPGQLADMASALEQAAKQLKSEGKYVANGSLFDKVWYGLPHLGKLAAVWLGDAVRDGSEAANPGDRQLVDVMTHSVGQKPPEFDPDPNWGQCGEAVEWGAKTMAEPIRKIFGPDAIFTKIELQSDNNPLGNHVANEVITPSGERYVVDMWETMQGGKPKIYTEQEWIDAWKNHLWIGKSVTITRGGTESSYQGVLEQNIREHGVERGLQAFRLSYKDNPGRAETIIASFKAHPWPIKPADEPVPPGTSPVGGKFR